MNKLEKERNRQPYAVNTDEVKEREIQTYFISSFYVYLKRSKRKKKNEH